MEHNSTDNGTLDRNSRTRTGVTEANRCRQECEEKHRKRVLSTEHQLCTVLHRTFCKSSTWLEKLAKTSTKKKKCKSAFQLHCTLFLGSQHKTITSLPTNYSQRLLPYLPLCARHCSRATTQQEALFHIYHNTIEEEA